MKEKAQYKIKERKRQKGYFSEERQTVNKFIYFFSKYLLSTWAHGDGAPVCKFDIWSQSLFSWNLVVDIGHEGMHNNNNILHQLIFLKCDEDCI